MCIFCWHDWYVLETEIVLGAFYDTHYVDRVCLKCGKRDDQIEKLKNKRKLVDDLARERRKLAKDLIKREEEE